MKKANLSRKSIYQAFVILGLFWGTACDVNTTPGVATACADSTAEIQVEDGGMIRVCGCVEEGGQFFANGSVLQCTVPAGTRVEFSYVGITSTREITVQGVQACPIAYATGTTTTCVIQPNYSGTYTISDIYNTSVVGSLIVQ
jgi:hypothetical protein